MDRRPSSQDLDRFDGDQAVATTVTARCWQFLQPFLTELDRQLDSRLVRTLALAVTAIIRHRDRPRSLLLTELGAILAPPKHAPAGVKRLDKLLRSPKWQAASIDTFLLERGRDIVATAAPGERVLCILDGSVVEKPESAVVEGLTPVRSSKARRLSRPRPKLGPGYYHGPPSGPVMVPGYQWLAALLAPWCAPGDRQPVALAAWYWYGHPPQAVPPPPPDPDAPPATDLVEPPPPDLVPPPPDPTALPVQKDRDAQQTILDRVTAAYGNDRLLHVWDRGFCGAPWLSASLDAGRQFVVRWKKGNRLRPASAPSVGNPEATEEERDRDGVLAWKLTTGKRIWGERQVPSPRRGGQPTTVGFFAVPVRLLQRDEPLWLVCARLGHGATTKRKGQEPWRLLTSLPVETVEQCWEIVLAYYCRWQIEQSLRYGKSELGIDSIRVRAWQSRAKLLGLAALAYAVLLDVLGDSTGALVHAVLRWAHRTGRRAADTWRPLYRLRAALAFLWQDFSPTFSLAP